MLITRYILLSAYKLNLNICMCILIKVCKMVKIELSNWIDACVKMNSISKDLYRSLQKYIELTLMSFDDVDLYYENNINDSHHDRFSKILYRRYLTVFFWYKNVLKNYLEAHGLNDIECNTSALSQINMLIGYLKRDTKELENKEEILSKSIVNVVLNTTDDGENVYNLCIPWDIITMLNLLRKFNNRMRTVSLDLNNVTNNINSNFFNREEPISIDAFLVEENETVYDRLTKMIIYGIDDIILDQEYIGEIISWLKNCINILDKPIDEFIY